MIPKFRAWLNIEKKFGGQEMCEVKGWDEEGLVMLYDAGDFNWDEVDIMQSTGLFDKNGVEIFENDIVKVDGWKAEVVKFGQITHEEDFGGFAIYQGFSLMLGGGYPEAVMSDFEIVGNVFENKELVEVENE